MSGWMKLHRSLSEHWIWDFKNPDKAMAWIDLLMLSRHSDGQIMIKGRVVNIGRGQVALSQVSLQKRWKWSQNKVKRFLLVLTNNDMITLKTNDLTTIITICNFDTFQSDERLDERPGGRPVERDADDQSDDNIRMKEGKKERKVNKTIEIPDGINQKAWEEWIDYRKSKNKTVSLAASKKQFKHLLAYSESDQQAIIDQSISNDYQGLFELKGNTNGSHQRPTALEQQAESRRQIQQIQSNIAAGGDGFAPVGEDGAGVCIEMA